MLDVPCAPGGARGAAPLIFGRVCPCRSFGPRLRPIGWALRADLIGDCAFHSVAYIVGLPSPPPSFVQFHSQCTRVSLLALQDRSNHIGDQKPPSLDKATARVPSITAPSESKHQHHICEAASRVSSSCVQCPRMSIHRVGLGKNAPHRLRKTVVGECSRNDVCKASLHNGLPLLIMILPAASRRNRRTCIIVVT